MKIIILTPLASNDFAYARGQVVDLDNDEAQRLLDAGHAIFAVETNTADFTIEVEAAGYTLMPAPSGVVPSPSGGYYFDDAERLHLRHPSGAHAVFDVLSLRPG